jgi:hypothetical protein
MVYFPMHLRNILLLLYIVNSHAWRIVHLQYHTIAKQLAFHHLHKLQLLANHFGLSLSSSCNLASIWESIEAQTFAHASGSLGSDACVRAPASSLKDS